MQAVVTVVGQYGGAPAFEYEIREESGALAAVDFVVVHPGPGEGWAEGGGGGRAVPARARGEARADGAFGAWPPARDTSWWETPERGRAGLAAGAGAGRGGFCPRRRRPAPGRGGPRGRPWGRLAAG